MGLELNVNLLKKACISRGATIHSWNHLSSEYWQADFRHPRFTLRFWETVPEALPLMSQRLVNDKVAARMFIPEQYRTEQEEVLVTDDLNFEYVERLMLKFKTTDNNSFIIKPMHGARGKGVFTNLTTVTQVHKALKAGLHGFGADQQLIERQVVGKDYRLFVIGDQVVAALNRVSAHVVGDGEHTIGDLIDIENEKRSANAYLADKLLVNNNQMTDDIVLRKGVVHQLYHTANMSTGATSINVTDKISEDIKRIAVLVHQETGLPYSGIDMIIPDISTTEDMKVLEINAIPDFGMHHYPVSGEKVDVAGKIIEYLIGKQ